MLAARIALVAAAATLVVPMPSHADRNRLAYVDMTSPRASVVSYAAALKAQRWHDACAHQSAVDRTGTFGPCIGQLASLGSSVTSLRVSVLGVSRKGRYADVRFSSTIGFSRGAATLVLRHGDWLISGFLPDGR
jgi:hypothetical protein